MDGGGAPLLRSSLAAAAASVLTSRSSSGARSPARWPGFKSLSWREEGRALLTGRFLVRREGGDERERERDAVMYF